MNFKGYPTKTHVSPNFTWAEVGMSFNSPEPYRGRMIDLVWNVLEPARARFKRPVLVNYAGMHGRGYRDRAIQERIWKEAVAKYGSEKAARNHASPPGNSQHEEARATDTTIEGINNKELADFYATIPIVGGIGIYSWGVHVDTRPRVKGMIARWNG